LISRITSFSQQFQKIKKWCIQVIENPLKVESQEHNRFRFWGVIAELEGHVLRVITLEDKKTIHNAFPDRGFKP